LVLSPDGADAWFAGDTGFWKLENGGWHRKITHSVKEYTAVALLGNDIWLTNRGGTLAYLTGGNTISLSEPVSDGGILVLRDGTVMLGGSNGYFLGVGPATHRQWANLRV
jgi:hypothetical protein